MGKSAFRALFKRCFVIGKTGSNSFTTSVILQDAKRSGRANLAVAFENIKKVLKFVLKLFKVTGTLTISEGNLFTTLHGYCP